MEAWQRRSRLIHLWRRTLPALMAAILFGLGTWVVVKSATTGRGSAQGDEQVRMLNPRFFGRDAQGRAYQVTAKDATRDLHAAARIHMTEPRVELQTAGQRPAIATATTGDYDENTRLLTLAGRANVDDGKGNHFTSDKAVVDTEAGEVRGLSAINGAGALGRITASSYAVYDRGARIVFTGGVHAHLQKSPRP